MTQPLPRLRQCIECGEHKAENARHFKPRHRDGGRVWLGHVCRVCLRARSRGRKKRGVRAKTIDVRRMTKAELAAGKALYPEEVKGKPVTRAECAGVPRPCPYVSCKHHLYLDVMPGTGSIKLNFPDLEVWEVGASCALDAADKGGRTLDEIGDLFNMTRERVRQVESIALQKLEADGTGWADFREED